MRFYLAFSKADLHGTCLTSSGLHFGVLHTAGLRASHHVRHVLFFFLCLMYGLRKNSGKLGSLFHKYITNLFCDRLVLIKLLTSCDVGVFFTAYNLFVHCFLGCVLQAPQILSIAQALLNYYSSRTDDRTTAFIVMTEAKIRTWEFNIQNPQVM